MFNNHANNKKIIAYVKTSINIASNPKNNIKKKINNILKYEKKNNLYDLQNDYFVWDYFRLKINTIIENYENQNFKFRSFIDSVLNLLKFSKLNYLPFLLPKKKVDFIFFGHPRGELNSGEIFDEYIDPLIDYMYHYKKKSVVMGFPHLAFGTKYNHLNKRFYIHWIYLIIRISTFFQFNFGKISKFYPKKFKKIGYDILLKINIEKWWFNFLSKTKPKNIFFVNKQASMPILRAANKLNINSYEIQHGSPDENKLTYNYYTKLRLNIPTYYVGWGKYWKNKMKNYYKKKFIIMGRDLSKKIPKCKKKNNNVLIIDQLIGRKMLVNKAIRLKKINNNLDICYRFHPSITDISSYNKTLKKYNIKTSLPLERSLRKDLINVRHIISHSSTAIYELGCRNYDIYIAGSDHKSVGPMSYIKKFSSNKKKFGLIKLDSSKMKKSKLFEKLNYKFLKNLN